MVGERLRVDGHLSRTGIQEYPDGMGTIVREYRPPDEVFSDASLDSMRQIPVTIRHPDQGLVTSRTWKADAVGNTGDDTRQDGDHLAASVWIHDAEAISRVRAKDLVELSVGYTAKLDLTPGETPTGERFDAVQREIRGNHLALLGSGEARGGPTVRLRLDSSGHCIFTDDLPGSPGREEIRGMKTTVMFGSIPIDIEAPEAFKAALDQERADSASALQQAVGKASAAEKAQQEIQAKLDTATEEISKAVKDLEAARDPKAMAVLIDARSDLLKSAAVVAGSEIKCGGDDLAVKRAALIARGVDLADRVDAYVEARFDTYVDTAPDLLDRSRSNPDPITHTDADPDLVVSIDAERSAFDRSN